MLKFSEIEPMVAYIRTSPCGDKGSFKIRIDERCKYQVLNEEEWISVSIPHNELVDSTFEPCEWVHKNSERYYYDFDIKQIVYSLISELRYIYKEEHFKSMLNVEEPNSATTIDRNNMLYIMKETNLIRLQEDFENWIKKQIFK